MVYITYRQLCLYSRYTHSLKLKICHCTCSILGQCLVYPDCDRLAGLHTAGDQMFLYDLLGKVCSHFILLSNTVNSLYGFKLKKEEDFCCQIPDPAFPES